MKIRERRMARRVRVGGVLIGGNAPVSVQTMVKQPTARVEAVLDEIRRTALVRAEDLGEREGNVLKELEAWEQGDEISRKWNPHYTGPAAPQLPVQPCPWLAVGWNPLNLPFT